jgi:hypothetical protein
VKRDKTDRGQFFILVNQKVLHRLKLFCQKQKGKFVIKSFTVPGTIAAETLLKIMRIPFSKNLRFQNLIGFRFLCKRKRSAVLGDTADKDFAG